MARTLPREASPARAPRRTRVTRAGWPVALILLAVLVALAVVVRVGRPDRVAWLGNFLLLFSSLLIQAFPFVLLGALVAAAIEVFLPDSVLARVAALPKRIQLPAAGLSGLAFPVCECGSVPVARRLIARGLAPSAAVTFMLAAPVVNPVVVASTVVASAGRDSFWPLVLGRTSLGLVVALAVGWVVGRHSASELVGSSQRSHAHESGSRKAAFFEHLSGDFLFMGRYLVLGAAIAAALQTFVPQSSLASVAGFPLLNLVAMMALAYLLSLCSESDAFVAASFVQFGVGAQLAFLVFGPMVDTKLSVLYAGTFNRALLTTVVVVVSAVTLAGSLWMEVLFG
jgi:uncharacterized protein